MALDIQIIPVSAVPNQNISFNYKSNVYRLNIYTKTCINVDVMFADLIVSNTTVMQGILINTLPFIPYKYLASKLGVNFLFYNLNGSSDDINYRNFGVTQGLMIYSGTP